MKRRGNCYVTCEALFHLLGGRASGWVPHTVRHEGAVHWYLVQFPNTLFAVTVDPTASQFKTSPPYTKGRGRGFLTKEPSKRARAMMDAMLWQDDARPGDARSSRSVSAAPHARRVASDRVAAKARTSTRASRGTRRG